jgi:NAD(P)-dependent dehydrogenase (short-subunit alcohol dehydrogenase family)
MGSKPATSQQVADEVGAFGWSAADVSDRPSVDAALAAAGSAMGGIDGVFVNAGMDGQGVSSTELSLDVFRRVLDVNVLGAFNVAQGALSYLARPATILFNASVNALRPEAHFLDYNASKAAVVSMAQTMALELASDDVTVLALAPGYFPSRMTEPYLSDPGVAEELLGLIPARRFGTLDEIAEVVDFLLGPSARFMQGAVVTLDGGRSV